MMRKKEKILITLLASCVMLCTACNGKEATGTNEVTGGKGSTFPTMEGSIEVAEDLPDRDIKVPDYLMEGNERNPDEASSDLEENGEEPVYHLSGEEQTEKARQIAAQIEDSINQVLADKDFYPNITGISVNPECTEFNVTFSGRELSLYENVLPVSLCIVGDKFQLYQGKLESELMTVVNYIDEDSGEIFNTINSREIE